MNLELLSAELERDEALRLKMYMDSRGIETIGIGHNLRDKPISERAARLIFADDVADVEADLDRTLPWWRDLDEVRQRVLANMVFNLGIGKLLEFKNTLAAMKVGNYVGAANGMTRSLWASQVGERARRLARAMVTGEAP